MMKLFFQKIWVVLIVFIMCQSGLMTARENSLRFNNKKANGFPLSDNNSEISTRSVDGKNILLSLILPGLGEWVAGEKGRAKIFMGFEVGLWASYFGSREYANVLERDYFAFAAVHAGVDSRNKGKQYWIDIGNADDIYEFNERRRVQRNLEATYPENEKYSWQWDSEGNRIEYSELRDKQDSWKKVGTFMIGGMVLNRIVSTIDIVRLIRKNKKSSDDDRYSFLHWTYRNNKFQGETVQLNFTWMF